MTTQGELCCGTAMTDLLLTLPTGIQKDGFRRQRTGWGETNTRTPEERRSKRERLLNLNTERRKENQEA
jgi:hypothetical protein